MHATTMKTKRHYTAPVTQRATVELEGGFCGSVGGEIQTNTRVESAKHDTGFDNQDGSDSFEYTIEWN